MTTITECNLANGVMRQCDVKMLSRLKCSQVDSFDVDSTGGNYWLGVKVTAVLGQEQSDSYTVIVKVPYGRKLQSHHILL